VEIFTYISSPFRIGGKGYEPTKTGVKEYEVMQSKKIIATCASISEDRFFNSFQGSLH